MIDAEKLYPGILAILWTTHRSTVTSLWIWAMHSGGGHGVKNGGACLAQSDMASNLGWGVVEGAAFGVFSSMAASGGVHDGRYSRPGSDNFGEHNEAFRLSFEDSKKNK